VRHGARISVSAGASPGPAARCRPIPATRCRIKAEAGRTPELERVVARLQDLGWSRQRIVDAIEADVDGTVASSGAEGRS
jgi:hypothetical protein